MRHAGRRAVHRLLMQEPDADCEVGVLRRVLHFAKEGDLQVLVVVVQDVGFEAAARGCRARRLRALVSQLVERAVLDKRVIEDERHLVQVGAVARGRPPHL